MASEVAEIIRDAYAGRIAATASERREIVQQALRQQPGAGGRTEGSVPPAWSSMTRGDAADAPRIALATDEENNSLVVTAPAQLADEVERLARAIDLQAGKVQEDAAEVVRVVSVRNAPYINAALKQLLGDNVQDERTEAQATIDASGREGERKGRGEK
jgi:hypothetical protein